MTSPFQFLRRAIQRGKLTGTGDRVPDKVGRPFPTSATKPVRVKR